MRITFFCGRREYEDIVRKNFVSRKVDIEILFFRLLYKCCVWNFHVFLRSSMTDQSPIRGFCFQKFLLLFIRFKLRVCSSARRQVYIRHVPCGSVHADAARPKYRVLFGSKSKTNGISLLEKFKSLARSKIKLALNTIHRPRPDPFAPACNAWRAAFAGRRSSRAFSRPRRACSRTRLL